MEKIKTSFKNVFQTVNRFQLFREVEGIEIFKVRGDVVPENSRCVRYRLFSSIGLR